MNECNVWSPIQLKVEAAQKKRKKMRTELDASLSLSLKNMTQTSAKQHNIFFSCTDRTLTTHTLKLEQTLQKATTLM